MLFEWMSVFDAKSIGFNIPTVGKVAIFHFQRCSVRKVINASYRECVTGSSVWILFVLIVMIGAIGDGKETH